VSAEKTASEITVSEEEQEKDKAAKRHNAKKSDPSIKPSGSFTKKKRKRSQDQEKQRKDGEHRKPSDENEPEENEKVKTVTKYTKKMIEKTVKIRIPQREKNRGQKT